MLVLKEIYDRGAHGFAVYAKGMDASAQEKAKIMPFVKEGQIVEFGCGNGTVLNLLSRAYPSSKLVGIDTSETMLKHAAARKYESDIILLNKNVLETSFLPKSIDTAVFCSVLHEVYSYNGYDKAAILSMIKKAWHALKQGGRIIIRDGVKPTEDVVYFAFKNKETEEKFYRFAREFGPYQIHYSREEWLIKVSLPDAMEFLSKYMYDANWAIEVKEQFGIYTLTEYQKILKQAGFHIIHAESYLIEWLQKTHYEKDVALYKKKRKSFIQIPYPHSTMILVGEKMGGEK